MAASEGRIRPGRRYAAFYIRSNAISQLRQENVESSRVTSRAEPTGARGEISRAEPTGVRGEISQAESTGGRLSVDGKGENMFDIGIDVGGTGIVAGLVDEGCAVVAKKGIATDRSMTAQDLAAVLASLAGELMAEAQVSPEQVKSIGVGVPGTANRKTGRIEYANNLPCCQGDVRQLLQEMASQKIYLENDANAAAWGEYLHLGDKPESFVMVTLGTGVGAGIIQDGKIIRGVNYAAGELGHMTIRYNGIPCNCGRRGCLEAYASGEALIARAEKMMAKKAKSLLWDLRQKNQGCVSGKLVFDAYRQGDKTAVKAVRKYAGYLSEGLANIINILQPQVLCIGGGISRSGDILLPMLQELVRDKIYSRDSAENTRLVTAALDNDAGVIGAAKLGLCKE